MNDWDSIQMVQFMDLVANQMQNEIIEVHVDCTIEGIWNSMLNYSFLNLYLCYNNIWGER